MNEERAWLVSLRPDHPPQQWFITGANFVIGRVPPADLIIPLPSISRRHAQIAQQGNDHLLLDLGSRNGTYCNGVGVAPAGTKLMDGDELTFGGAVAFRFRDPAATVDLPRLGRLRGIWLNEATHEVWIDGRPVRPPLSAAQYSLLALLYQANGEVVSRDEIVAAVWAGVDPAGVSQEAIDGLIKRLRGRLRQTQPEWEALEILRGQGLRLIITP